MIKTCLNCNNEFNAKRDTAKYCSGKCRIAHSRLSVTVSVTNGLSVTQPDVTVKDSETRWWLTQEFKDESKSPDEIKDIMQAQDDYYNLQDHYFIPARLNQAHKHTL